MAKQKKEKEKTKSGRKSTYETKLLPRMEEIKQWAQDGQTEKEMYKAIGISQETWYKYKRTKVEFLEALKINKEIADMTVENSLYMRANGYEYTEEHQEFEEIWDKKGISTGRQLKKTKIIKKKLAPDTTAQIFYLKNRKPKEWRDKKVFEGTITNELESMSDEDLKREYDKTAGVIHKSD